MAGILLVIVTSLNGPGLPPHMAGQSLAALLGFLACLEGETRA